MKSKRTLALAMAGAMMAGAFATAVPVMAEGTTTTVTLTVDPKNTYTMTVPATTALNLNGDITALTNGVTISSDNDMSSDYAVNVTVSSENDWKLKSSGRNSTIGYTLYSDDVGTIEMDGKETGNKAAYKLEIEKDGNTTTTAAKGLWFTGDEANQTATKQVYAKVNASDVKNAASGDYQDTVTFTAEAGKVVRATVEGSEYINNKYYYTVFEGTSWMDIFTSSDTDYDGKLWGNGGPFGIYENNELHGLAPLYWEPMNTETYEVIY